MTKLQLNEAGNLKHLITTKGLKKDLIFKIFDLAESFLNINNRDIKNVPLLRGKTVCNLFFENSTRTRTTFEIAAKRLSADVINLDISSSSQSKGESILDTIDNLIAMGADIFIVRHSKPGIPESFKVLILELQSLGLDIGMYKIQKDNLGQTNGIEIDIMTNQQNDFLLPSYQSVELT